MGRYRSRADGLRGGHLAWPSLLKHPRPSWAHTVQLPASHCQTKRQRAPVHEGRTACARRHALPPKSGICGLQTGCPSAVVSGQPLVHKVWDGEAEIRPKGGGGECAPEGAPARPHPRINRNASESALHWPQHPESHAMPFHRGQRPAMHITHAPGEWGGGTLVPLLTYTVFCPPKRPLLCGPLKQQKLKGALSHRFTDYENAGPAPTQLRGIILKGVRGEQYTHPAQPRAQSKSGQTCPSGGQTVWNQPAFVEHPPPPPLACVRALWRMPDTKKNNAPHVQGGGGFCTGIFPHGENSAPVPKNQGENSAPPKSSVHWKQKGSWDCDPQKILGEGNDHCA